MKQHMIDLNISTVTSLHYHNCTEHYAALRVKIDFEDFPMDSYFKVDIRLCLRAGLLHVSSYRETSPS